MHEPIFAAAARPRPRSCLHLPLLPYSIGHELALWHTQNPLCTIHQDTFATLPEPERHQALMDAVDICSQTHLQHLETAELTAHRYPWHQIHRRRRQARLLRIWATWTKHLRRLTPEQWDLHTANFRAYLDEHRTTLPVLNLADPADAEAYQIANHKDPSDAGRPLGAPIHANILQYAIQHQLHRQLHLDTPFDCPYALTANLLYSHLETTGALKIINHRETQVKSEMANHRAQEQLEKIESLRAWDACQTDDDRRHVLRTYTNLPRYHPDAATFATCQTPPAP